MTRLARTWARRALPLVAMWPLATSASAQDRAHGSVLIYSDTDAVQVISPVAAGSVQVGKATASAEARMDLITAASVDLVTAASPRGFSEQRTQLDASGRYALGEGQKLDAGYHVSHEPDFLTHGARLAATRDVLQRQLSLGLAYAYSRAQIGRVGDTVFARQRQTHDLDLSLTRVINPTMSADFGYGVSYVDGFQANPYRHVRLYAAEQALHQTAVAERTPDQRVRQALTGRLRTRLHPALFGHLDYRLYADSWGLVGHTLTLRAVWALGSEAWLWSLEARGHVQGRAAFYRARYATFPAVPAFRTADKELGPMWTALGGTHLTWNPELERFEALRLGIGVDVLHMRYLDYAFLAARTALLLGLDITWEL